MNTLAQDLRYALRGLAKNKGFTLAAVLSLAIGIGANTSIFSVANALLLHPLPYKDADRLAILWNRSPGLNITEDWFSTAQYFDIKTGQQSFEQVAIAIGGNSNLIGDRYPERVGTIRVSSNLLPMLGVHSQMGRLFGVEDDSSGRPPSALLSYGIWVRRYGADPHIIGRSITIDGVACEVVGILPQGFSLPREVLPTLGGAEQAEILLPLPLKADAPSIRDHEDYNLVAKLKPGISAMQAQREMDTITARLRHDHPDLYPPSGGLTFSVVPLLEQVVGDVRRTLFILLAAVGCLLLIACANVANLLLSRAVARQKELAVRTALGASRSRIVRQLLTESVLLAVCGGIVGILFALLSMSGMRILGHKSVPRLQEIGIDGTVLLFTLALSVFSGILFGLAPVLRAFRLDLISLLKDADRGSAGTSALWGRGNNIRRLLVVFELAVSIVVLIAAGLLVRSFERLQNVPPGFNPAGLLTFQLTMTGKRYEDRQVVLNAYRQLWERLEHLPGVTASGGITALPLSEMYAWGPITIEGHMPPAGANFINADQRIVGGHYFQAMQIPLLQGRFFTDEDTSKNPRALIIDEYMAQQFWPNQDAVGKRIRFGGLDSKSPWGSIVGVVGRVKQYTLDTDSRIALYLPETQFPQREMNMVLRSGGDPIELTNAVKSEIGRIDPDLPMYYVRTMLERVNESLARRRFSVLLLGLFAALSLVLAAIGIYGVIAYLVSQGTREIGIRMALGATHPAILRLVIRQGVALALAGEAIGLILAFALTRFMRGLLFGISATDSFTFAAISMLLMAVAMLASYIPARRAARIAPMIALRTE